MRCTDKNVSGIRLSLPGAALGVALVCLLLWGCGKKTTPLPPDTLVPGEVRNFSVSQDGAALSLQWLIPKVNIENQPLTDIQGFLILRNHDRLDALLACPPELNRLARIDLVYPQAGEVAGEQVRYRDVNLTPGRRYFYQVVGFDRDGRQGQPSAVLSHVWDVLPQPPAKLEAQAGDRQITLTWPAVTLLANGQRLPGGATYNIYRQTPGAGFSLVNPAPVTETRFQDITVANDAQYRYLVRTVRQVGSGTLESLDSATQTATATDLTPPAPVLNLVAVPTDKGIELRWDAGREPDLAGYRVFRRSLAEPQFRLLTPQLLRPAYFVDQDTAKGVTYFYYVTAVDNAPRANQSLPSEAVQITR